MKSLPTAAGSSSFDLIDQTVFYDSVPLLPQKSTIVDAGCGTGVYLLNLIQHLEDYHEIIGLDLWEEGIAEFNRICEQNKLIHVKGIQCDLGTPFPLKSEFADLTLMTTVIHDLKADQIDVNALIEVYRILKPGGVLIAVEFKKIDQKPGPRIGIRLSPEELKSLVEKTGLKETSTIDLGQHLYMSLFKK